jgi:glycosyltransferase involved in cell wall biosynthesis
MRVLYIHQEAEYFAGAEVLLGYFLDEIRSHPAQVSVAAVQESQSAQIIPKNIRTLWIPANARFSLGKFFRQVTALARCVRRERIDLLHGWSARDWELTATVAALTGRPAVGTLHDHPQARFISPKRQKLMRASANWGLKRLICISDAVRSACLAAGYTAGKLVVAHNGLPRPTVTWRPAPGPVRLGFIGAISERKGLRGLFEMLEHLDRAAAVPWELFIAGAALDAEGRTLQTQLQQRYAQERWYARVHWCGWVKQPSAFLSGIDLLICPSSEFEPFGLVICEAGWLGIPVLGTRMGGIPEIIEDGKTGWLFAAGDWRCAAELLAQAIGDPVHRRVVGENGRERVRHNFDISRMARDYLQVYSDILDSG